MSKKTKKLGCPTCEEFIVAELVQSDEVVTIRGVEVSYKATYYRCTKCGTEIETFGQLDANLAAARAAYDEMQKEKK